MSLDMNQGGGAVAAAVGSRRASISAATSVPPTPALSRRGSAAGLETKTAKVDEKYIPNPLDMMEMARARVKHYYDHHNNFAGVKTALELLEKELKNLKDNKKGLTDENKIELVKRVLEQAFIDIPKNSFMQNTKLHEELRSLKSEWESGVGVFEHFRKVRELGATIDILAADAKDKNNKSAFYLHKIVQAITGSLPNAICAQDLEAACQIGLIWSILKNHIDSNGQLKEPHNSFHIMQRNALSELLLRLAAAEALQDHRGVAISSDIYKNTTINQFLGRMFSAGYLFPKSEAVASVLGAWWRNPGDVQLGTAKTWCELVELRAVPRGRSGSCPAGAGLTSTAATAAPSPAAATPRHHPGPVLASGRVSAAPTPRHSGQSSGVLSSQDFQSKLAQLAKTAPPVPAFPKTATGSAAKVIASMSSIAPAPAVPLSDSDVSSSATVASLDNNSTSPTATSSSH